MSSHTPPTRFANAPLLALALAGLCPQAWAQACDVAEGQTLINTGARLCQGGQVLGLLHNPLGATVTSLGMSVGAGPLGPGEVLTDGAFISREPDFFNWSKVTVGPSGSFAQLFILHSFGAFTNHGEFRNIGQAIFGGGSSGRGVLRNTGVLHNAGTLDFTSETYFYFGNADGSSVTWIPGDNASLVNSGEILNDFSGSLLLDNVYGSLDFTGGRLINRGYLRVPYLPIGYAGSGTVELLAQGTADIDTLVIGDGYRQLNAGLLLIGQRLQVAGRLQNDGTITVRGFADIDSRAYPGQAALINNGHLAVGGQVGNTPFSATLLIDHQGYLENNGSLRVEAGSTLHNRGSTFFNNGDLTNRGQITNAGGYFAITASGRFAHDGTMDNIDSGNVIFAAGSITTGTGHYRQSAGATQLDGRVEIASFEIAGGRLCGSGFLNGSLLMSGGALCPGNSPGSLHIGGDVAFLGGTLQLEIAGTAAGLYDVLQVDGALSFAAGVVLDVAFIGGYVPHAGDRWSMLNVGGTTTGLAGLDLRLSGLPAGYSLALDGSGALTLQLAAVPEPGSALLMLVGLCGLVGVALRRQVGLAALAALTIGGLGGLGGLGALPAQASDDINRVVPVSIDLRSRICAGSTVLAQTFLPP